MLDFPTAFRELTRTGDKPGNDPFPWQVALYDKFAAGDIPQSCNLPTGLGKTSVIAVWLIALANHPDKMPRRLVYVVNRRTVVDQTTDEVEKYKKNLAAAGITSDLALSTLRGQFADNREWSADPSRPAVICGTVDMIGSRLLFSGYGVGFKGKPLHAGFLGQDALLVHDEAHLEPAFQALIDAIQCEQHGGKLDDSGKCGDQPKHIPDFKPLKVMELTATSRGGAKPFGLTDADRKHPTVIERVEAVKAIHWKELDGTNKVVEEVVKKALNFKDSGRAILVFVKSVADVKTVRDKLPKGRVATLTGTMRGKERDELVDDPIFRRFLPGNQSDAETTYLVCTSAGEVGVNISADHLICDLTTFENMAQRFGRVNRFGQRNDTEIHIVCPTKIEEKDEAYRKVLENTFLLLKKLRRDAAGRPAGNPAAMGELVEDAIREGTEGTPQLDRAEALRKYVLSAYAPPPTTRPTSDILFDAWALTTVAGDLPGRPPVAEYLHGVEDEKQYETQFAWRKEVELFSDMVTPEQIAELLDAFPLKPHELLRENTFGKGKAYEQLDLIAEREPQSRAWVVEPNGGVSVYTLEQLAAMDERNNRKVALASRTVVLPPKAGGLTAKGLLDGNAAHTDGIDYDVASLPPGNDTLPLLRFKVVPGEEGDEYRLVAKTKGFPDEFSAEATTDAVRLPKLNEKLRAVPHVEVKPAFELSLASENEDDENAIARPTEYLIVKRVRAKKGGEVPAQWPSLQGHLDGVRQHADGICERLNLDPKLRQAVVAAAGWHDIGKGRAVWQRGAGNGPSAAPVAKTLHGRPPENLNHFRHELGSMIDVSVLDGYAAEFKQLDADQQDLALHLMATHHGRGRPHFPGPEVFDGERPQPITDWVAHAVPGRFARLQRKYGRWGLAYLESLLRAADILDSQRIENTPTSRTPEANDWQKWPSPTSWVKPATKRDSSIRVAVDPTNPGQFFACCGLLELADRLWPGAEGWFAEGGREFQIACSGTLDALLKAVVDCEMTNTMTEAQHARFKEISAMKTKERKSTPGVEDEEKALKSLLRESPIVLKAPFEITLDWFADDAAGGSRFKTWAGQQSVREITRAMKDALKGDAWRTADCFKFSVTGCGLPFNFDSDLGGQGGAIDIGFSFDPLAASALTRIESSARPALELLAFVGLQRFRPAEVKGENRFLYTAWSRPLPVSVARPAACGALPAPGARRFEFRLLYRTKYLKSFLPATPFTGASDE